MELATQERILKLKKARLNLAERIYAEECRNLTGGKRGQGALKRIYAGTEDFVNFFETIISTLGLDVKYEIEDCDGEKEIVIREVRL